MRKLLSILGATTMIITAPTTVVACRKKLVPPEDDGVFDHARIAVYLKNELSILFSKNLQKDFYDYDVITSKIIPPTFEFINYDNLLAIKDATDLNDTNSENYKKIYEDLTSLINFTNLNNDIEKNIVADINFRPVLVDNKNPVRSYSLENLVLKVQPKIISLHFEYKANFVYISNELGYEVYDSVSYQEVINLVADPELGEELIKAKEEVLESIAKASNSFEHISNGGKIENTGSNILINGAIRGKAKKVFDETQLSHSDFKVNTNSAKLTLDYDKTQDASVNAPKLNYGIKPEKGWKPPFNGYFLGAHDDYEYPKEWLELMKPVLLREKSGTTAFINKLLDPNQNLIDHQLPEEVKEKIKNHPNLEIAEAINHFNLAYNIEHSEMGEIMRKNNYAFEIDENHDINAIVAFAGFYKGVKIDYIWESEPGTLDLDDYLIPIKQYSRKANSKELYKDFIAAAVDLQQRYLLGQSMPLGYMIENNGDRIYDYKEFDPKYYLKYIINVDDANKKNIRANSDKFGTVEDDQLIQNTVDYHASRGSSTASELEMSTAFTNVNSPDFTSFSWTVLVSNNKNDEQIFKHNHFKFTYFYQLHYSSEYYQDFYKIRPDLRTYFFSSGLRYKQQKTYFSLGERGDLVYYNEDEEKWKPSLKMIFNFDAKDEIT